METVSYKGAALSYKKIGRGESVLVMFYGYGQNSTVFDSFVEGLHNSHTIYIIDLFFHGNSQWDEEEHLTSDFWLRLFLSFIEKNNIAKFELIGFSLGSKFALLTYETMPTRVNAMYLIAPDGFHESFWYKFFTSNRFTLKLFKFILDQWAAFRFIPYLAYKTGLLTKEIYRFVSVNLDTSSKRMRVYQIWRVFKYIHLPLQDLATQVRKHYTPLVVFIGKHDHIIKEKYIKSFCTKTKRAEIIYLDTNHQTVLSQALIEIKKIIIT
jgi:pimeloyl-ACP methyl ester carboxylesterase